MRRESSIPWQRCLAVGLLLLVAAVLARLPSFNESLWHDEAFYTSFRLTGESLYRILFHDVHPPLYPSLMKGWTRLFGDSEISVRFPSLLFGLASLAVVFALARAWFGPPVALLATILVAFSPVHIWHSQEVKNNMLLLLLSLLTVYGVQRAWMSDGWKDWLLFTASATLALWTNHFSLWVVMAAFLWLWLQAVRNRRHRSLKRIVMSTMTVALAYLPVIGLTLRTGSDMHRGYLRPFTIPEVYNLLLVYLSHGNTLRTISPYAPFGKMLEQHWAFFLIDGFFALLLGTGLFVAVRRRWKHGKQADRPATPGSTETELLLLYFLIPPIALLAASLFYPKMYIERSMIVLLPPFFILIASGAMSIARPRWRHVVVSALLVMNILALVNLWVIKEDRWTVYKPNPDWRAFAQDLREDGTGTVVFTSSPSLVMRYYARESDILVEPMVPGRNAGKRAVRDYIPQVLKKHRMGHPRFFYVAINRYWYASRARKLKDETIDRMYPLIEERRYFGLDVYKYGFYR